MASYSDYLTYRRNADCKCKYSKGDKGDTGATGPQGPPGSTGEGNLYEVQYKGVTDLSASSNFLFNSSTNTLQVNGTSDLNGNLDVSGNSTVSGTLSVTNNATLSSKLVMPNGIKIGDISSGEISQGADAIAIGNNAGNSNQGANSIAIGNNAGVNDQSANTIIINATGNVLDTSLNSNACFIDPIRDCSSDPVKNGTFTLKYNTVGKEVTYDTTPMKGLIFFNDSEDPFTNTTITLDVSLNDTSENGSLAFYDSVTETFGFNDVSNNENLFIEITFSCDASGLTPGSHTLIADISGVNNSNIIVIDSRSISTGDSYTQTFGPVIFKFGTGSKSINYSDTYKFRLTAIDTYEVANCKLYLNAFRLNS